MSPTNFQVGGGYTYQWECSIALALKYFFMTVSSKDELHNLISGFLDQVTEIQLEGEDPDSKIDWEDINLLNDNGRILLIQVKTKQAESEHWTLKDPLLVKALYKFYKSNFLKEQPDDTRFVFLTNRPFNEGLVDLKKKIGTGQVRESNEAKVLLGHVNKYAEEKNGKGIDEDQFYQMLSQTLLENYYSENHLLEFIQTKLQALGRRDWDIAHAVLFEHFSHQSTQMGGSKITPQALREVLGITLSKSGKPNFKREADPVQVLYLPVNDEEKIDREKRKELLKRVNREIDGFLEYSLHNKVLIQLDIVKSDGPEYTWGKVMHSSDEMVSLVESGRSILDVFKNAIYPLLILGQAGFGKTTELWELSRQLVEDLDENTLQPIPVYLHLSLWEPGSKTRQSKGFIGWLEEMRNRFYWSSEKNRRNGFNGWLEKELKRFYEGSEENYRFWIEHNALVLLLDGLDEVNEEYKEQCIQAINAFIEEHIEMKIAICCRIDKNDNSISSLKYKDSIILQPLNFEKVDAFLSRVGNKVATLRSWLHNDDTLKDLVQSPLMLDVMIMAYQGETANNIPPSGSIEELKKQLFDAYVSRMFSRIPFDQADDHSFPKDKMVFWLSWLAHKMSDHNQSVFFIESMQPSWLKQKWEYQVLVGLAIGMSVGIVTGLGWGLLAWGRTTGHMFGLIFGLMFGLIFYFYSGQFDIQPVETLSWSWSNLRARWQTHRWGILFIDLFFGLVFGLMGWRVYDLAFGLVLMLVSSLGIMLLAGLIAGLDKGQVKNTDRPNQDILLSASNFLIVMPATFLISGLIMGIITALFLGNGLAIGLTFGLAYGLVIGLFVGLIYGGLAFLQHFALRFIISSKKFLPWRIVQFLDHAVKRTFLNKRKAGSYSFINEELKEYFKNHEI